MNQEEIKELFDRQAAGYDMQEERLATINECLYLLLRSLFAELLVKENILCAGAGTGKELFQKSSFMSLRIF